MRSRGRSLRESSRESAPPPGRMGAWAACGLVLLGLACKPPSVTLKPKPAESVELDVRLKDLPPEEGGRIAEGLQARLEVPVRQAKLDAVPKAALDMQEGTYRFFTKGDRKRPDPEGSQRVLQVVLVGGESIFSKPGMGKAMLVDSGVGALLGATTGIFAPFPEVVAVGAGIGGLAGLAASPWTYRHSVDAQRDLGYVPFDYSVYWRVLLRSSAGGEATLAAGCARLDDRKWLHPVPAASGREAVARENQQACLEALEWEVRGRLAAVRNGQALEVSRPVKAD